MAIKHLRENIESEKLRDEHNKDLIRRMRNGEPLTSFDSQSSWFPPRPVIEKDKTAVERLYGKEQEEKKTERSSAFKARVVPLTRT